jgi:phosphoribosylformimino-5-aminoimidazole carboxamide ribotide isomerase
VILYPAVDLLEGRVVRLKQGDFDQSTCFSDEPAQVLAGFAAAGARFVHIVDLSGARSSADRQTALLAKLVASAPDLRAQVGGGVRCLADVAALFAIGVDRVVIGSALATDPAFVRAALQSFGAQRITFAIDVRIEDGVPMAATHGWKTASGLSFAQLLEPYLDLKPERVLCTDIGVDGMMVGPNLGLYRALMREHPAIRFQASGGVGSLDDLRQLKSIGVESAIVGKALYAGAVRLTEALALC